jgi:hypothetical protein
MVSGGISACDTFDPSFYIDAGPRIEVGSSADVAASPDAGASTDAAADALPLSPDAPVDGSSS